LAVYVNQLIEESKFAVVVSRSVDRRKVPGDVGGSVCEFSSDGEGGYADVGYQVGVSVLEEQDPTTSAISREVSALR
jgi:hypothetical protein